MRVSGYFSTCRFSEQQMISVIIPTYNRAKLVEKAILSVLEQTRSCAEVLVVDDGSTDDTAGRVGSLVAPDGVNIRYLCQEHLGAAAARNRGISEAAHDLLCFLDSDDRWHPRKLEIQLRAMEQAPEYGISHTRERWYRQGRRVNQKKKHNPPHGSIFQRSLAMCVVGMSTIMVHRRIFAEYGVFDESLLCCEDYDLWLRVGSREKFLLVAEALTLKDGGREDQLSVIHRMGMDTWRIRSLCKLLESRRLTSSQYQLALAELVRKCTIYGNGCIKHGRPAEGKYYLGLPEKYRA